MIFDNYQTEGFFDEIFDEEQRPRAYTTGLIKNLSNFSRQEISEKHLAAEAVLRDLGVTFRTKDHGEREAVFPFDLIPRVIDRSTWLHLRKGLEQRIIAINMFLNDVYSEQKILKERILPADLILSSPGYRAECQGITPPKRIYTHITGSDLVRDHEGNFYVLEDNLRCPSGVSYVVSNREVLKRTFPQIFSSTAIEPVDDYPDQLFKTLLHVSPVAAEETRIVVLTPGVFNAAYYEHAFLAKSMGVPLVEGHDLCVLNSKLWLKTARGLEPVHVVYRRIDDDFLDPLVFRPDSLLGVPGLFHVYQQGNVALVNAPGNGVADDKAVYAFMPKIIRYYLGEESLLQNVPTYLCAQPKDRRYVLQHLDQLVVKSVDQSGGYGMLIGPKASSAELEEFKQRILASPRSYIAQPTLALSRVPTLADGICEGRHVDLRPFALYGKDFYVQAGGLTRVALKKGSLVVNSSQGGGSKDTWILKH